MNGTIDQRLRRLEELEGAHQPDAPLYVSFTEEEWAERCGEPDLLPYGAVKVYVGISPDDWPEAIERQR